MSTAGKVLVVLIMLVTVVWMILTSGVAQLNRNGNKALKDLTEKVAKLEEDLKSVKVDIVKIKDETTLTQEKIDRDTTVIRSRQTDVQKANSAIKDVLSTVQYQLATLSDTVKNAEQSRDQRAVEKQAEEKALADARGEVVRLQGQNQVLMDRLTSLRQQFQDTLKKNTEMLSSAVR